MITRRQAVLATMACTAGKSHGQARNVTLIVPQNAGGTTDRVARLISEPLASALGSPVVVLNRPGAGGTIGTAEVAKAAPDGLTLGLVYDSHAIVQFFYTITFDVLKSFDYVSLLVTSPQVVVTSPNTAYHSLDDLLSTARKKPGEISFGAMGEAASTTVNSRLLADRANIQVRSIPYPGGGGGAFLIDLLEGRFDFAVTSFAGALPHIKSGKLRALAYGGAERSPSLPQVPLVSETIPGFRASSWFGIIAPAGLPKERLNSLSEAFRKIVQTEPLRSRLISEGYVVEGSTPDQFRERVVADAKRAQAQLPAPQQTTK